MSTVCYSHDYVYVQNKAEVPHVYQSFHYIFRKAKATGLTPPHSYDCSIKLLPDMQPPHWRIYPFSLEKQKTIEEYIHEALQQGYIVPSTSQASAGFFFVEKNVWFALLYRLPWSE